MGLHSNKVRYRPVAVKASTHHGSSMRDLTVARRRIHNQKSQKRKTIPKIDRPKNMAQSHSPPSSRVDSDKNSGKLTTTEIAPMYEPTNVVFDNDNLSFSFDDQQTRQILMNLLLSRLEVKMDQSRGIKKELYPFFFEIVQDLLDELTIEFNDKQLHINISMQSEDIFGR